MKTFKSTTFGMTTLIAAMACLLVLGMGRAFAEIEISIDEDKPAATEKPTPVPVAQPAPVAKQPEAQQPAVQQPAASQEEESVDVEDSSDSESVEVESEETTPKAQEIHGVLKMRDVYEAGIKAYKRKEYDQAIKYLGRALEMKDRLTPKYYSAEAHAMLGVIYQFYVIHPSKAYSHYKAALAIDPHTRTARKHLREVKPH